METTYYSVHFSIDPKVTGISNADVQCEIPSKYRNQQYSKIINFLCNTEISSFWKTMGQYPDFQMDLEFVKLKKKAILTDFLDMSPVLRWTFLVSERAISLMNSANVSSFKNYKVNLWSFDGELIPGYTFIYCPPLDYTTVDFDQSVFLTGIAKKRVMKIHSPIEFENAVSRRSLEIEKLNFNNKFNKKLDFFCPRPTISQFYISRRLKAIFEKNKITGLEYKIPRNPELVFQ